MTKESPTSTDDSTAVVAHSRPNIVVIGLGGAGGNAVDNMIRSKLDGVSSGECSFCCSCIVARMNDHI